MKAQFLLFSTDFTCELKRAKIKDGKVTLGNKEFIVDKARPFEMKTALGTRPLYLLKWNSIEPMKFKYKESNKTYVRPTDGGVEDKIHVVTKDLVTVDPKFDEAKKITPEILRTTQDARFLKSMKRYSSGKSGGLFGENAGSMLPLILGVVFGAILLYMMFVFKVIPLPTV